MTVGYTSSIRPSASALIATEAVVDVDMSERADATASSCRFNIRLYAVVVDDVGDRDNALGDDAVGDDVVDDDVLGEGEVEVNGGGEVDIDGVAGDVGRLRLSICFGDGIEDGDFDLRLRFSTCM